jgi:hypothetical protein
MLAATMRRIERTGGRYLALIAAALLAGLALWLARRHPVARRRRSRMPSKDANWRETAGARKGPCTTSPIRESLAMAA